MAKVWATKLKKIILWKRKLKAREVSQLSEGHTAGKPWSQEWDFSPPDSKAIAPYNREYCLTKHISLLAVIMSLFIYFINFGIIID